MTDREKENQDSLIGTQNYKDFENNLLFKLNDLYNFFSENEINYSNILKKQAYPNSDHYMHVPGQHNTDKWLQAVRDVYYKEKEGNDRVNAIKNVTIGWKVNETYDFLNWLKFYEEGSHLKYKAAQVWYENDSPGYFLHIKKDPEKTDSLMNKDDISYAKDSPADELSVTEKKRIIQKQKNKIVGRLDSIEKLLRSDEGHLFAGKELENLMETIYGLKKKIQLLNKTSTSVRLYEDMFIREANILTKKGFYKSANIFLSLAEENKNPNQPQQNKIPNAPSPVPPNQGSGSAGGLPSPAGDGGPNDQNAPKNDNSPGKEIKNKPEGINKFLSNLDPAKKIDQSSADDINLLDIIDPDDELIVEAQALPPPPPKLRPPPAANEVVPLSPPTEKASLEVSEEDLKPKDINITNKPSNFDSKVNDVFSNITIEDIIAKLENLSKIFKTREIPRQLAIVDMMLDSLGLAAYFPTLSEATNKSLESNNYISTRVDDILSKLHGSTGKKDIDLAGDFKPDAASKPEVENLRSKLQKDEEKDKARKELRKQQQDEELGSIEKETPEVEIEEGGPTPVPPPPPPPPPTKP